MNAHPSIPKVPALKIPCCIIIFHIKWPSYIILLHKLAPPCSTGFGETQDNSGTLEISRGCLKTPISIKWCFHALSFFFLLSFFQVLASHPHETIHIVFSLWDITLQPPASHLFFGEKLASAKLAASNMSHKQYIYNVYVWASLSFFFPLIVFSSENYI